MEPLMEVEPPAEVVGLEEAAEASKPSAQELVVSDPRDEHEVFVVLDRHDEQQIIEEFQRRALKVMLYDFPKGGKQLIDLSYAGVNEAIRLMNATGKCQIRIRPETLHVEEVTEDTGDGPESFVVATVYAEDQRTGYGQYGSSSEPKYMKRKTGERVWDVFARSKAMSKAQRNALKTQIPEGMRQTLIAQYRGDDVAVRAIQAGAGAEALAELPAPLEDEHAEHLRGLARAKYDEIREVAPGGVKVGLTPATFHAYMTRAEGSHERLESFVEYLADKLRQAKEMVG